MTLVALLASSSAAATSNPIPGDPFTDPAHDINNPLRYIPRRALTGTGVGLYFLVATAMAILMVRSRYRARYMICIIIGGYCELVSWARSNGLMEMNRHGIRFGDAVRTGEEAGLQWDIHRRISVRRRTTIKYVQY
jgi:hypothetical protein